MVTMQRSVRAGRDRIRSAIGTSGLSVRIAAVEAKIDALLQRCAAHDASVHPSVQKDFVSASLPNGMKYELSVESESADPWHAGVAANALQETMPVWRFLMSWLKPGDVFLTSVPISAP